MGPGRNSGVWANRGEKAEAVKFRRISVVKRACDLHVTALVQVQLNPLRTLAIARGFFLWSGSDILKIRTIFDRVLWEVE